MECLLLRFDAPLMSFGEVVVDHINRTWRFPGTSMLAGLLANAFGWDHRDTVRTQALQDRLRFAARWDVEPELLTDYHTVDLGQNFLVGTGWTTRGRPEERGTGAATRKTHIRLRDYWANGVLTLAVTLEGRDPPTLDDAEAALRRPTRPLFLGRKPCLPAAPILLGRRDGETLRGALRAEPLASAWPRKAPDRIQAIWPVEEGVDYDVEERYDVRDWSNNIHRGSRRYAVGFLGGNTS